MSGKMLKQNAVWSKNTKLKCLKFYTLLKREDAAKNKCFTVWYWKDWLSISFCLQLAINWWCFLMFSVTFWCLFSNCCCSTFSRWHSCTWKAVWQQWIGRSMVGWHDGLDCCQARNFVSHWYKTRTRVWNFPNPITRVWKRQPSLQTLVAIGAVSSRFSQSYNADC